MSFEIEAFNTCFSLRICAKVAEAESFMLPYLSKIRERYAVTSGKASTLLPKEISSGKSFTSSILKNLTKAPTASADL